jgi:hypothetical protein
MATTSHKENKKSITLIDNTEIQVRALEDYLF